MPLIVVIDSVDRLAKDDQKMFKKLIYLVKDAVNLHQLNVVFMRSERHVLPLLHNLSEKLWSGEVIDVHDVDSDEAERLLSRHGFDPSMAKYISKVTGGRLTFLIRSIGSLLLQQG